MFDKNKCKCKWKWKKEKRKLCVVENCCCVGVARNAEWFSSHCSSSPSNHFCWLHCLSFWFLYILLWRIKIVLILPLFRRLPSYAKNINSIDLSFSFSLYLLKEGIVGQTKIFLLSIFWTLVSLLFSFKVYSYELLNYPLNPLLVELKIYPIFLFWF